MPKMPVSAANTVLPAATDTPEIPISAPGRTYDGGGITASVDALQHTLCLTLREYICGLEGPAQQCAVLRQRG